MPRKFLLITAPAKINLYLGVHPGCEEDGYHRVDTVMTAIDLADTVAISPSHELAVHTVPPADFPMESNTAYRAARAMGEAFEREASFTILIDKHIPIRAGLGGPSTDAAAVILGICQLWDIDPADPRIEEVARAIGADVPFFLYGPPAYLDGRGDTLRELFRPLTGTPVALVKPSADGSGVTAVAAYRAFDEDPAEPSPLEPLLTAMREHDETAIFEHVANNLGPAAVRVSPEVGEVLTWLREQPGVRVADVCGSGSMSFAVCETQMDAERIAIAALDEMGWWGQAAKMEKSGPYIAVG
ncbi:4-(cytidine 5'-diphospho)-2-C-methyl-D-erythritol kinase [Collinsella vaginalis]|uniref:4-(cytidine 5'-diphospho)-2-C-methyl-D-erythritol kinase n=1 Tax=Collinsella vaginalis TaxID=1870987 RepID=UPI000A26B1F2|nr:4-(cytidine 5'-diphospho)-2-C-methyl-D-erythritol kinase [Collinsella vaginalis]